MKAAQSKKASPAAGITFDDSLVLHIGQLGRGQLLLMLTASLFWISNAMFILLMVFTAVDPIKSHLWHCKDPADAACTRAFLQQDPTIDFCALDSSQWHWTDPRQSLRSEFDLVCGNTWKSGVANSFFFFGYLVGSGYFGYLADVVGRKPVLFGTTALCAVATAASTAVPNYWVYLALRAITGQHPNNPALG
jgi:MFS transporter, OCT family, solute carrier family 22 (organic cation transporter), member 4/5